MSTVKGLKCDGCGRNLLWTFDRGDRIATKSVMEQTARDAGWEAPDKQGEHRCWHCRSEAGKDQWRRRENLRLGLPADYGRGRCRCGSTPRPDCCKAGHPGVVQAYPGWRA